MLRKTKEHVLALFLFSLLTIVIFYQFFFRGLIPFPGNYMLAWYEPWKTDYSSNGTITISHKPVADDVFRQLYPFKTLTSDFLKQFQLPLWNPYNGSGMPLLATMHSGLLTPFNLLFVFLPKYLAWGFYISIQFALIAFFTFLYCRKIGIAFGGSIFSGAIFSLSGFVVARLLFGEYIYVLSTLPLLLYLIESYIDNPKTKKIWLIPFVVLFMFISGQPQVIAYVLLFTMFYYIYKLFQVKKNNGKKISSFFIPSLILIGVGLAGIQLLPTLELFGQSAINPSSSKFIFDRFLLPLQHLITIAIPNYFGNQSTYNYWGSGDYIETVASIGLIPLFFAFLSIGRVSTKIDLRRLYLAAIILTIILVLDWFGTRFLYSMPTPIISTGIPSRIFALTTFSISILAGYGFDKWFNIGNSKEIKKYVIIFSIFVLTIFAGTFIFYTLKISCNNEFILNCRNIALRNTILETTVFITGAILICFYTFNKKLRKIISITIFFLVIAIGLYNGNKFLPFSAKNAILPQNDLINKLQEIKDARVFGLGEANIKTNFATYFKFYDPNYYDPLYNKRYGELVDFSNSGRLSSNLSRSDVEIASDLKPRSDSKQRRDRLFDILSVKYLILKNPAPEQLINKQVFWQNDNWTIILNEKALPFSFVVKNFEIISNKENVLSRIFETSFDPKTSVILEKKPEVLPTDQILVMSENYYPGWKAFVDGKETKIYRANYTFRAITVPQGKHDIKFEYQPESLKTGIMISIFSLITLLTIYLIKSKGQSTGRK